jgi:hypothetical protein
MTPFCLFEPRSGPRACGWALGLFTDDGVAPAAAGNRQRNATRIASCLPWAKPARAAGVEGRKVWGSEHGHVLCAPGGVRDPEGTSLACKSHSGRRADCDACGYATASFQPWR